MATNNPVTGQFGTGNVQFFGGIVGTASVASTFVVPQGISSVRARVWGAGSSSGGAGGFAMKTIYGLVPGASIVVTPGASNTASTTSFASSFGSYVSANGAVATAGAAGVGGDINYTGGTAISNNGAGAPSIYGNGTSADTASNVGASGFSGAGGTTYGGNGLFGIGGFNIASTGAAMPTSGLDPNTLNLDAIGTGGGGSSGQSGVNGGGGAGNGHGGFPAGGGGAGTNARGGAGLVIVEW
jgi:hypothetical protein